MTKRLVGTALLVTTLTVTACSGDEPAIEPGTTEAPASDATADTTAGSVANEPMRRRLWIAPTRVECEGVEPMLCLQVAQIEGAAPELFYNHIEGFEFVEGTSSVIEVDIERIEDPLEDELPLRYTLVEILEQTSAGG